jgi:hypothetical protein
VSDERQFTGYDPKIEPREQLAAQCIDYDFGNFTCSGDIPETRGVKEIMRRDDQWRMNSCAAFGCTGAAEVAFWLQTGVWRQFAPHWTYRRGQEKSNIRGDSGATIDGVVRGAKENGLLPEDVQNDGIAEFPYPKDNYNFQYPASATALAADRKIAYSAQLKSWQACVNFLQAGQGAIVIGGPWGNWKPGPGGICRRFASGGGGHARSYVDWIHIDGELMLVEANSHFASYGLNGFAFHAESFVTQQLADRWFVAIGVSDVSLGPGDKPKQRRHRRYVKLV